MDFSAAIARFASLAQQYCDWLESEPTSAANEHFMAAQSVAELYAAALSLPGTEPTQHMASVPESLRAQVLTRLRAFPFQYYWEIFDPVALNPEEPVCGDITDDLGDIYLDLKEGLLLYALSEQAAVWHWRTTFGFHWGRHAASALHALHNYDPES